MKLTAAITVLISALLFINSDTGRSLLGRLIYGIFRPRCNRDKCARDRWVVQDPSIVEIGIIYTTSFCNQFGGREKADAKVRSIVDFATLENYYGVGIQIRIKNILANCEGGQNEIRSLCTGQECKDVNINEIGEGVRGSSQGTMDKFRKWWKGIDSDYQNEIDAIFLFVPNKMGTTGGGQNGRAGIEALCNNNWYHGIVNAMENGPDDLSAQSKLFAHELGHILGTKDLGWRDCTLMGNEGHSCWNSQSLNELEDYLGSPTGRSCLATWPRREYDFFVGLEILYPDIWSNYAYYYGIQLSLPTGVRDYFQFPGILRDDAPIPAFNPVYYWENNTDLNTDQYNPSSLLLHWLSNGIMEGRTASVAFDPKFYLRKNSDLRAAFGPTNYYKAVEHWLNTGIREGRKGSAVFNPKAYLNRYKDLRDAFGAKNYTAATKHWLLTGFDEGRIGV